MIGFAQPKGIPFIRALPDGQAMLQFIERPVDIDVKACRFIAVGGRYFIAIISDDEVRMSAASAGPDGELREIADEVSPNGIALTLAVDRLVRKSVEHLEKVI
jgi:hypothetical protein